MNTGRYKSALIQGMGKSALIQGGVTFEAEAPFQFPELAKWHDGRFGMSPSEWKDRSGNGDHVTQGTGGNQPTLVASNSDFNGLATLDFPGGASNVNLNITTMVTIAQPFFAMVVFNADGTGGGTFGRIFAPKSA